MSDNTQDSGSSRKSIRGRIPVNTSDASQSIKNSLSHFGASIARGVENFKEKSSTIHDRMASRDATVYSNGVRELDGYGYERFNINDDDEIFISRVADSAFFNDSEPVLVRATDGNFVGSSELTRTRPEQQAAPVVDDARSFFGNVPKGTATDTEFRAQCGVNNNGHIEPKVDNSFLGKISKVNTHHAPSMAFEEAPAPAAEEPAPVAEPVQAPEPAPVEREVPDFMKRMVRAAPRAVPVEPEADDDEDVVIMEVPAEVPTTDVPAEVPAEVPVAEVPVEEPLVEAPAEEPAAPALNEDVFIGFPAKPKDEFFVDVDPAEEPEVLDCDSNSEYDDYDWLDECDEPAEVPTEVPVEAPAEIPVAEVVEAIEPQAEEPIEEVPMEVPVEETVPEAPAEIPVADAAPAPVDMDAIIAELSAKAAFEEAAVSACIEEIVSAETPSEPRIEGLYYEGDEPQSGAEVNAAVAAVASSISRQSAATAAVGLTADGEGLSPMRDPVNGRPKSDRAMRFKFNNGVLVNVNKEESKEGLQSPLERGLSVRRASGRRPYPSTIAFAT